MHSNILNKAISVLITIAFLLTNISPGYATTNSKSLFKNKKIDYDKISSQSQDSLEKRQSVIKGEDVKEIQSQQKQAKKILSSHLEDISQIHIPQELGRIVEVHQGTVNKAEGTTPLIVGIQDLHTNPEAELNLAKILELLLKDYNMGLVCSEGAVGKVDTSSISRFPDQAIKEKVSHIFVDSGELTGEEYLSITKYPELPIWGIETKDIYFNNIISFNRIMKFSPSSQVFISQVKKAVTELKPKVYSKDLLDLDQKESEFISQKLDTDKYLKYLLDVQLRKLPSATYEVGHGLEYKNISLLTETMEMEKHIDQLKIMKDSQNLLLNLQATLQAKALNNELDSLIARANLFKDQKISPFSFYSYLKDLALKHHLIEIASAASQPRNDNTGVIARSAEGATKQSKYPALMDFIDYLTKVNSLDSTKLFTELEDLNFEIKESLSKTEEQKTFVKIDHNINFLENFFNLKVSNEDLDYYLNNKETHKVAFFKDFLPKTLKRYNISAFIDYNPDLIDNHLQELEDFYKVVKDRDIAMVTNSLSEIEKRKVKLATLVHGGFHTKGITKLLKEKGYSYIIVSPYSKTDIDEENYHFLLTGKRKPILELIKKNFNLPKIINNFSKTLRVPLALNGLSEAWDTEAALPLARIWGGAKEDYQMEAIWPRVEQTIAAAILENPKIADRLRNGQSIPITIEVASSLDTKGEIVVKLTIEKEAPIYTKFTANSTTPARAEEFAEKNKVATINVTAGAEAARVAKGQLASDIAPTSDDEVIKTQLQVGVDVIKNSIQPQYISLTWDHYNKMMVATISIPNSPDHLEIILGRVDSTEGLFFRVDSWLVTGGLKIQLEVRKVDNISQLPEAVQYILDTLMAKDEINVLFGQAFVRSSGEHKLADTASRTSHMGFITQDLHGRTEDEGLRAWLREVNARDPENRNEKVQDLEKTLGVSDRMHIYAVKGLKEKWGIEDHHSIRDGVLYIDYDELFDADGDITEYGRRLAEHGVKEWDYEIAYAEENFRDVEAGPRQGLVDWLDNKDTDPRKIAEFLLTVHWQAPKVPIDIMDKRTWEYLPYRLLQAHIVKEILEYIIQRERETQEFVDFEEAYDAVIESFDFKDPESVDEKTKAYLKSDTKELFVNICVPILRKEYQTTLDMAGLSDTERNNIYNSMLEGAYDIAIEVMVDYASAYRTRPPRAAVADLAQAPKRHQVDTVDEICIIGAQAVIKDEPTILTWLKGHPQYQLVIIANSAEEYNKVKHLEDNEIAWVQVDQNGEGVDSLNLKPGQLLNRDTIGIGQEFFDAVSNLQTPSPITEVTDREIAEQVASRV